MTLGEITEYVSSKYPEPIRKTWEPSDFELKYKFKNGATPKARAKLDAERARQNAKLAEEYDEETRRRNAVFAAFARADAYPRDVSSLFYLTVVRSVEDVENRHKAYLNALDSIKNTYGECAKRLYSSAKHVFRKQNLRRGYGKWTYPDVTDELWETFAKLTRENFGQKPDGEWRYDYPAYGIEDRTGYVNAVLDTLRLEDADVILNSGGDAVVETVRRAAAEIDSAANAIEDMFGGVPETCEIDPSWGVGGKFNAVLSKGNRRISFCSFFAGGHTVQRLHVRYKITRLKDAA